MMRGAFISACLMAGPVQGFPCQFTTECYEAEPCAEAVFELEVDVGGEVLVTSYGDLTIVAVKDLGGLVTLFATGQGAEYLLSVTPRAAVMGPWAALASARVTAALALAAMPVGCCAPAAVAISTTGSASSEAPGMSAPARERRIKAGAAGDRAGPGS